MYSLDVFKTFGETKQNLNNDLYLTETGSICCLFGSLRFVWSAATDRYSFRIVYSILLVMQIILASTMVIAARSKAMYTVWLSLCVFCESGHFTLVPNVLKKIFGENANPLYAVLSTYTSGLSFIMIGLLVSPMGTMYVWFFELTALLSAVALALNWTLFSEEPFGSNVKTEGVRVKE
jgi:hypothetical protein